MHAMRPPQLTAVIRARRPVSRALPLGHFDALGASATAALATAQPAGGEPRLEHVTRLHQEPFGAPTPATSAPPASSAGLSATGSLTTYTAANFQTGAQDGGSPVATLTENTLHVLRMHVDAPNSARETVRAAPAVAPQLLARLPLAAICSTAAAGEWVEVVFTSPRAGTRDAHDAVVLPGEVRDGGLARAATGGGERLHSTAQRASAPPPTQSAGSAAARDVHVRPASGDGVAGPVEGGSHVQEVQPGPSAPAEASGGLPFRVLRLRCEDGVAAAALRDALVQRQGTLREMLQRRRI